MKKVTKILALMLAMVMLTALFTGCGKEVASQNENGKKLKIGISLPTQREERWVLDKENFEKVAKELGVEVAIQIADNDAAKQQSQCENLIAQGIDVLILAPHDGKAAANIVTKAHEAGIKVVSYDRLALDCDLDLYVTFDSLKIGEMQGEWLMSKVTKGNVVVLAGDPADSCAVLYKKGAMNKIQPRVDSGDIKVVANQDVKDWQPSEAMKHMENALTANGNDIQGVLAPNDGTAGAVIQALAQQGMAGSIPVTGQDAEVAAAKRILEGTQGMTVFNDIRDLGKAALEAAVKFAKGEAVATENKEHNGKIDVPAIYMGPKLVDKDNLQKVLVDSGFMDKKELEK
jgi:D-xylose transport system substrate-binding protein